MMPKTLVISWMVPPAIGGSATIMENLTRQFSGNDMMLLGEASSGGHNWSWANELPAIRHIDWISVRGRYLKRRLIGAIKPLLVGRHLKDVLRVIREDKFQCILAVYPCWQYLWLAYLAARRSGLPLFLYFHNTYLENTRGMDRWMANWLQPRVFREARHVFLMSVGLVDYYRRAYPGLPVSPLLHTFSEPLPPFVPPPSPGQRLSLAFSGTITDSCSDALSRIIMAVRNLEWVDFKFYTPTPPSDLHPLFPLPRHWRFEPLPRARLLTELRQADVLVLPHGFVGCFPPVEYQTIFPTKTIEYLISGRPILAHSPPGCFLTRFLKEHGCALVVEDKSVPAIAEALHRLREDGQLRAQLVRAALETAQVFQAKPVASRLRHTIVDIIRNCQAE